MNTIKEINKRIVSYGKAYENTKDLEEFRKNMHDAIVEIEKITPVTPFFSSYLFRMKLDCENVDQVSASGLVLSLETFLERLVP